MDIHNLIPLSEAKHFLRITSDIDNEMLKTLLEIAMTAIEGYTGQAIVHKTYSMDIATEDRVDDVIRLLGPVHEILSVRSRDGRNLPYEFVNGKLTVDESQPVIIQYVAGLFKDAIPGIFKVAIFKVMEQLYSGQPMVISDVFNVFNQLKKYKL